MAAVGTGLITSSGIDAAAVGDHSGLVWPESIQLRGDSVFCLIRMDGGRALLISGPDAGEFSGISQTCGGIEYLFCPLDHGNAETLRKVLPFTAPGRVLSEKTTIGLGDRLGTASPGLIRELKRWNAVPVLAQQSVRELELMGRDYSNLIDSATWGVFQEGYTLPWGADGDHLKTAEWVHTAVAAGCTMITADLSDHIHSEFEDEGTDISQEYRKLPEEYCLKIEAKYLKEPFRLDTGMDITFSSEVLRRIVLVYKDAVDFALELYNAGRAVSENFDFEISIDETEYATLPEAHIFVARELLDKNVKFSTMAPRFVGEFQKGIDYIGDMDEFSSTFPVHAGIARYFGYKLSIHSGSDKFSVFPVIGTGTQGQFHLKTSGTHWLQALSAVAGTNPELFRKIFKYSLEVFPVTRKYYQITPDLSDIPDIEMLPDNGLRKCLENVNSRQVLHVSYGEIYKNEELKDALFSELIRSEDSYYSSLGRHLRKHFETLKIGANRGGEGNS